MQKEVSCNISNTGPIIPPEEKGQIFTPFYQVKNNDLSHTQGSGLGLAIVKEYVLQNNGTVSVVDHDSGARFTVTFPLVIEQNKTSSPVQPKTVNFT